MQQVDMTDLVPLGIEWPLHQQRSLV
jgi:hypothetical protein